MKRIADFIVSKRYIVLAVSVVITIICGILSLKVGINADLTKYLPDDFSMTQGLEIMNTQFPALETDNTIRVMAQGLDDEEKAQLLRELEGIEYVSSVTYNSSSEYNKDGYTLFVVNTTYDYGSKEELAIESALETDFAEYELIYKNDNLSDVEIPPVLLISAVSIALVILFIMCGSWFEPVMFMIAIGFAVIINAGTNIFLGSISNVTQAISAIMQMVLSMDYSIILMNRYRQEKELCGDKYEAMKKALKNSFSSVASSAFTTIVGLLMLVFMKFKIGFDIGIVLAKGVFSSMLCVFTVLPVLIVMCDKLITKTTKKELNIPMGALARFSHRFRHVFTALFAVIFVAFMFLQNNTQTAYSLEMADPIADVFPQTNMVVMIYDNDDEEAAAQIADEVEKDENVKQVLGYPNLLGKEYTAEEMLYSIDNLSTAFGVNMAQGIEIDRSMLDLIYYSYYDGSIQPASMTDFIEFLTNDIAKNKAFDSYINEDMRAQLSMLEPFGNKDNLTKPLGTKALAEFFSMDEETVEGMMLLYFGEKGGADCGTMTLEAFADFVINDVSKNEMYASMFDEETLAQLDTLKTYTNKAEVTKPRTADEMAEMFGIEPSQMRLLYVGYSDENTSVDILGGASRKLSLQQVINFVVNNSDRFSTMLNDEYMQLLPLAQKVINGTVEGKAYTPDELAALMNMDSAQLKQLYLLYISQYGDTSDWRISVKSLLDFLDSGILDRPEYSAMIEPDMKASLSGARTMVNAVVSGLKLDSTEMTALLTSMAGEGILDKATVDLIYLYRSSAVNRNENRKLSIEQLFNHLATDLVNDPKFSMVISDDMKAQLGGFKDTLTGGIAMLKGESYSRMIFQTVYPTESKQTAQFLNLINEIARKKMANEIYLIGNSPMTQEMSQTFDNELLFITLLTSIAIFIIVAISFRSLIIPALLVLIVQCGVYITITVVGWQGYSIYFLALLIVECILMGATIDYGILLTNYYREHRKKLEPKDALKQAYKGSMHTIMTSGLIMVLVTGIIATFYTDPTVSQICRTISIGVFSAIILIVFILPGVLATFDKAITKERKQFKKTKKSK